MSIIAIKRGITQNGLKQDKHDIQVTKCKTAIYHGFYSLNAGFQRKEEENKLKEPFRATCAAFKAHILKQRGCEKANYKNY